MAEDKDTSDAGDAAPEESTTASQHLRLPEPVRDVAIRLMDAADQTAAWLEDTVRGMWRAPEVGDVEDADQAAADEEELDSDEES